MRRLKRLLLVLFLVDVSGIDAVDPHYCAGHDVLSGSVWLPGAAKWFVHEWHSHWRNKHCRGRSDDRQRPGSGNAHIETSGHWGSSA